MLAVVLPGVKYVVLPVRVVTLTMLGCAMIYLLDAQVAYYRPKTIEKAIA